MTVSDEVVEAAAQALHDAGSIAEKPWAERNDEVRELYREDVRIVAAHVAPFIAAQAWEEGARAMFVDDPLRDLTPTNPYRSGT